MIVKELSIKDFWPLFALNVMSQRFFLGIIWKILMFCTNDVQYVLTKYLYFKRYDAKRLKKSVMIRVLNFDPYRAPILGTSGKYPDPGAIWQHVLYHPWKFQLSSLNRFWVPSQTRRSSKFWSKGDNFRPEVSLKKTICRN